MQNFGQISGALAIEFGERCYIKSLDNGLFVLGPPHDEGIFQTLYLSEAQLTELVLVDTFRRSTCT